MPSKMKPTRNPPKTKRDDPISEALRPGGQHRKMERFDERAPTEKLIRRLSEAHSDRNEA